MRVYRLVHDLALSKYPPFRPAFTNNRWNTDRTVVAYASDSLALAAWEILTYWAFYDSLDGYRIFTYDLRPDDIEASVDKTQLNIRDRQSTQRFGDNWVLEQRSLALRVPSLRLPASFNYLINPQHPEFSDDSIEMLGPLVLDERIKALPDSATTKF